MTKAAKKTRRSLHPGTGTAHDTRAKALAGMTKAELVKTIKTLDKRVTTLLNQVDRLQGTEGTSDTVWLRNVDGSMHPCSKGGPPHRMPWEQD